MIITHLHELLVTFLFRILWTSGDLLRINSVDALIYQVFIVLFIIVVSIITIVDS